MPTASPSSVPNTVITIDSSSTSASRRLDCRPSARSMPNSRMRSYTIMSSAFAMPNAIATNTAP